MYIPIYEPNAPEQEYALRLLVENNKTRLCIVDKETGELVHNGRLVFFNEDGCLERNYAVNKEAAEALGIQLAEDGTVAIGD